RQGTIGRSNRPFRGGACSLGRHINAAEDLLEDEPRALGASRTTRPSGKPCWKQGNEEVRDARKETRKPAPSGLYGWRRARHLLKEIVVRLLVEFANFGEFLLGGRPVAHGLIQSPQLKVCVGLRGI